MGWAEPVRWFISKSPKSSGERAIPSQSTQPRPRLPPPSHGEVQELFQPGAQVRLLRPAAGDRRPRQDGPPRMAAK